MVLGLRVQLRLSGDGVGKNTDSWALHGRISGIFSPFFGGVPMAMVSGQSAAKALLQGAGPVEEVTIPGGAGKKM